MAAFGFCSSQAPRRSEASSPYPPALIRVQVPPGGTRALDVRTVPGSGFHDCLPRFARERLFSGTNQGFLDFPENLSQ